MGTVRLTVGQAIVRFMAEQFVERDGRQTRFIAGVWGIFGQLGASQELREAAAIVRPGEVWSLNGIQLQLRPDGTLDRERLDEELPPRLEICRALGPAYFLVVPPRTSGVDRKQAAATMQEGLAIARDRAADDHVRIAFEFLGFADCRTPSRSRPTASGWFGNCSASQCAGDGGSLRHSAREEATL